VPLIPQAREISAFVTPAGFYQYRVMSFSMKNAPATFQQMINRWFRRLWRVHWRHNHVQQHAGTTPAASRSFSVPVKASSTYSQPVKKWNWTGMCHHVVGQGKIRPINAKIEAVATFPVPTSKNQLMKFFGMVEYYAETLQLLLSPWRNFYRRNRLQLDGRSASSIWRLLTSAPVLAMPDFDQPFIIHVDANDLGLGAVLMQENVKKPEHAIGYFSQKFSDSQRNYYSTSEKEALALLLSLQHFEFYAVPAKFPIDIYTDHNPQVYLNRVKNKNQHSLLWSLFTISTLSIMLWQMPYPVVFE